VSDLYVTTFGGGEEGADFIACAPGADNPSYATASNLFAR